MLDEMTKPQDEIPPPPDSSIIDNMNSETLRARVREHANTNSTSLKSIALLAGVGESTFTAWINGKYRGNNDEIDKKIRNWLKSEDAIGKRRLALPADAKFAQTRSAIKFLSALEHAQAVPDIVVIAGGAGVGKTFSCKHYQATRPNVWLLTSAPSISSPYAMLEYLREILNIPETAPHKVSRAITLKLLGTQGLLVFDEAQHLRPNCIDELRGLYDNAGIGIAFVGNEEVWKQIDGGGRKSQFAQLFSRVGMRVTVPRPSDKDAEILLDSADVMEPKQRALLKAIAKKPGALRGMMKTLRIAHLVAAGAEEPLSEEHINAAWMRLTGTESVA